MTSIRRAACMLALFVGVVFLGVGVGGTGRDGQAIVAAAQASTDDLTGRWEGTWDSSKFDEGTLTALLAQSASSLSGEVTITDTACFSVGAVSGTVSGDAVVFGAVFEGDVRADFEGTVRDDGAMMEGSYKVSGGACAGDTGTWHIAKIARPCDANGDGMINGRDALSLFRFLRRGGNPLSGYPDCNRDGLVNFRDVIAIFKTIAR